MCFADWEILLAYALAFWLLDLDLDLWGSRFCDAVAGMNASGEDVEMCEVCEEEVGVKVADGWMAGGLVLSCLLVYFTGFSTCTCNSITAETVWTLQYHPFTKDLIRKEDRASEALENIVAQM